MCSEFLCNFSIFVCFLLKAGTAFVLAVCHVVDLKKNNFMQSHFYIHLYSRCAGESLCSWKLSSMMLLYNPMFCY